MNNLIPPSDPINEPFNWVCFWLIVAAVGYFVGRALWNM